MPHRTLEVNVEPKVLEWARRSIGLEDTKKVAKRLNISKDTISKWESGQKKLTIKQLRKIAKIYKRPLAAFFLSEPPKELPLPKDFRTLPSDKKKPFSATTRLAIRRGRRLQSLISELAKSVDRKVITEVRRVNLIDNPEVLANRVRMELGIDIQTQFSWKDGARALDEWKKFLEKQGVFVLEIGMPLEETRGFSLAEGRIPVIVLNLRDAINGKIFSLFHEYGHLLLHDSGICDMGDLDYLSRESKSIERFCNRFAGAVLVPKGALLDCEVIKSRGYSTYWSDEILYELAKSFKVSSEVILRRLVILHLADKNFYETKHEEWRKIEYPRRRGRRNLPKECVRKSGASFVWLVLETYRGEKITYSDVADYLETRLKHIPTIEKLIKNKV